MVIRVPCTFHRAHELSPAEAARAIVTLYGILGDSPNGPRTRCAVELLDWSLDGEMYREYVDAALGDHADDHLPVEERR